MEEETLMEIGKIDVNATHWENTPSDLAFEWIEPSNYCLFPDEEYSIDITKDKAVELIEVLTKHFKL